MRFGIRYIDKTQAQHHLRVENNYVHRSGAFFFRYLCYAMSFFVILTNFKSNFQSSVNYLL